MQRDRVRGKTRKLLRIFVEYRNNAPISLIHNIFSWARDMEADRELSINSVYRAGGPTHDQPRGIRAEPVTLTATPVSWATSPTTAAEADSLSSTPPRQVPVPANSAAHQQDRACAIAHDREDTR